MRRLTEILHGVALTLWVGGLWSIGYLVAPALFHALGSDRQLAGQLAGRLFELIGWVGLACAAYLLLFLLGRLRSAALRRWDFWLLILMLLLTAVGLFGVQPLLAQLKSDALPREVMQSVLRDRFAAWHGVSSILYLLQSLLGLLLVAAAARGVR
ncbi:MAG: DUF4149 domain-containing protein [Candidatus Accumulibacter sp.]|uniref:DUF4149 domain-containing protein n=1 Tax=Accumulibacter sp. TaxID=2053492 RepID=UPI001A56ED2B|nr:DUF4149 domain-containing protein [Accumulibacter sp.]MBL8392732.1 DUF4149 domain-containing protein [Accumulibacter sp.]HRD86994.1 DUF4149 domain-containing protein [Accumulibacter sp.]